MPDSVYKQTLDVVAQAIRDLNLDKVGQRVRVAKFDWDDAQHYGITVSPGEERYGQSGFNVNATNETDLVGYPCVVTIAHGTHRGTTADIDKVTDWRQAIRRRFHNKRLTGVAATGVIHVLAKVQMNEIEIPEKYRANIDAQRLTVWCWFMEPRS